MGDWTWTGSSFSDWLSAQLVSEPSACAWPCSVDADTPLVHTHSKKSYTFEQWFDHMWLYCNSAFVDWLGLPGAYWLLIGIMLSACSCLLVNWSVLQLGAQLGKWLCMEMVVQLWVQMASMVWSSGELRHSRLIDSIDTWSQFDLSYMGSHLGSCWKVCVCLTSSCC